MANISFEDASRNPGTSFLPQLPKTPLVPQLQRVECCADEGPSQELTPTFPEDGTLGMVFPRTAERDKGCGTHLLPMSPHHSTCTF